MDIILGTKVHNNNFEDFNSSVLNGAIATVIVLLLKQTRYDPIKYIEGLF
jgi:hypothetical protein